MDSLDYRLKEFLAGPGRGALLLDASAGLSLGVLSGLEDFSAALRPLLPLVDGLVCSPGQLRRLESRTRADSALLVRADWTNVLRDEMFPLPPEAAAHVSILDARDALELGAVGMVVSFLLGYEETVEADCLKTAVQLALQGKALGLPLVVEVLASGPRISLPGKAAELGASYALESGADVVAVRFPGQDSLKTIGAMLSVPWLLKPSSVKSAAGEWRQALDLGASGLWLDHTWLPHGSTIAELAGLVHTDREAAG